MSQSVGTMKRPEREVGDVAAYPYTTVAILFVPTF